MWVPFVRQILRDWNHRKLPRRLTNQRKKALCTLLAAVNSLTIAAIFLVLYQYFHCKPTARSDLVSVIWFSFLKLCGTVTAAPTVTTKNLTTTTIALLDLEDRNPAPGRSRAFSCRSGSEFGSGRFFILRSCVGACVQVILPQCVAAKLPYNYTIFPNFFGNLKQIDTPTVSIPFQLESQ